VNEEIEILQKARAGDPAAAEKLFTEYLQNSRSIQGLLRRALPLPEDREEMLHEIFLQLTAGKNLFRGESRLSTYVYQVARITLFQKFRRENTLKRGKTYRTIVEASELQDGIQTNPEYSFTLKQGRKILHDLIDRLPLAYREALRLRVVEDLSYEEIANRLSLPINTVSTKIHKGKKLLAMLLKERGVTEVFDF
jgi:RNA polymerase sigma-70 factor (ECF subfamily)